ncbi:pickpocket protein 28 [Drosophila pseudoobscura]|uniref:Pickpocket protein 28 n=1 Tax=Drosophila pseudoobscura pseudoobscura TaxID=46245 RepID=A0A6I8UGA3_DROPS|nr:pickpocket protein 28 [Drosophila pseudoobscura]
MRQHRSRRQLGLFWSRQPYPKLCGKSQARAHISMATWRRILARNTDEFCRNTTIHGLKYINNGKLRSSDRVFFGVAMLAVVSMAAYLIHDAFDKWNTTPVIVGIDPELTYITNEPFPAVTICNLNQALSSRVAILANDTAAYAMLQVLCRRKVDYQRVSEDRTNWEEFITNISQPCQSMVIDCRFGADDYECARMFYPIVTDEGLCCVFNMLHPRYMYKRSASFSQRNMSLPKGYQAVNWHAELGYRRGAKHTDSVLYPRPAQGTGESLGLSLTLDVQADAYYCSSSSSIGFKIALHSPNESPNVRETGVLLAPGMETKLRIDPAKIRTENHLRRVHRKYRRCLFRNELKLRWFAHYTQRNCAAERLSGLLLRHCGCVSFYMPRLHRNDTICSVGKRECVQRIRFRTSEAMEECLDDCLPSCFDLTFNTIAYSTKLSHDGLAVTNPNLRVNFSDAYVERNVAVVNMYFKDQSFRASKQTEFIGFSDFLSNVGGLMGLFLGFSFLSIAECLYFALIRPCRTCSELRQLQQQPQQRPPVAFHATNRAFVPGSINYISPSKWFQTELARPRGLNYNYNHPA